MKITLERNDLIALLSKALNYRIEDDDLEIQAKPFEVHIRSMRLEELSSPTAKTAPKAVQEIATRALLSEEELLEQNEALIRENLGPEETYDPPGPEVDMG
jgi:hypothetical protein